MIQRITENTSYLVTISTFYEPTGHCERFILIYNINISHSTNTLGKGMNPIILPPAMGK